MSVKDKHVQNVELYHQLFIDIIHLRQNYSYQFTYCMIYNPEMTDITFFVFIFSVYFANNNRYRETFSRIIDRLDWIYEKVCMFKILSLLLIRVITL